MFRKIEGRGLESTPLRGPYGSEKSVVLRGLTLQSCTSLPLLMGQELDEIVFTL